jgi:hypothetical protein
MKFLVYGLELLTCLGAVWRRFWSTDRGHAQQPRCSVACAVSEFEELAYQSYDRVCSLVDVVHLGHIPMRQDTSFPAHSRNRLAIRYEPYAMQQLISFLSSFLHSNQNRTYFFLVILPRLYDLRAVS